VLFRSDTSRQWEEATAPAAEAGIRVCNLRTGVVLDPRGGALKKMLPVFRLGLGGRLGNGKMYMSWISIEDEIGAIEFLLAKPEISGPVNLISPNPVRNEKFTRTLARVLNRPVGPPAPAGALKLAMGEMAEEMLLVSQRVRPGVLTRAGFEFIHPGLEEALRFVLGRQ